MNGCPQFMVTRIGDVIIRPLSNALYGDLPKQVFHIYFLYMEHSTEKKSSIFIIRDEEYYYVCIFTTESVTAETAAFGLKKDAFLSWTSEVGSH